MSDCVQTGAFCLAMILSVDLSINMPQAICLCTTSEIAEQVALTCAEIAKYSDIKVYCATKISANESALGLHGKAHIIVGTPGTVFRKLIQNREFDPKGIRMMVLDEADVMLTNTQNGLSSQVWSIFS